MDNVVKNESSDERYFTITPRLVWALSRTPHDYALWCVVKDIAGKGGECILGTPDLAALAMMSDGQVSLSRQYWLSIGLLTGGLKRDPGYPQPVYHLTVPNIWKRNVEWSEAYASLGDRVAFKQAQKESLHQVKASPGEEGVLPGEEGVLPGETKKNYKKIQKEEHDAALPRVPRPPDLHFEALADITNMTPPQRDWKKLTRTAAGQLARYAKELRDAGATPDQIYGFQPWFKKHDWRGKEGQWPTPADVVKLWSQYLNGDKGNGSHTHRAQPTPEYQARLQRIADEINRRSAARKAEAGTSGRS